MQQEGQSARGNAAFVDVNNANIHVYTRFPGMYPTIAYHRVRASLVRVPQPQELSRLLALCTD
jgi:hypothetical protein